jgi:cephalosporin hydroxylase
MTTEICGGPEDTSSSMITRSVAERRGILRGAGQAWREGGPRLLGVRTARRAREAALRGREALAVRLAEPIVAQAGPRSIEEALAFAQTFRRFGVVIRPMQIATEIRGLLELVAAEQPAAVLEIGTARGGTLYLFAQVARDDAVLVSVDLPEGDASFGGRSRYKRRGRLYRAFGRGRQRVEYISGDSHDPATRERVVAALAGRPVDLLFIDGDHTFAGVKADYEMFSPLVRAGGLIAFHDIVPGEAELVGDVPDFWRGVRGNDAVELVESWEQGGCGIGLIRR